MKLKNKNILITGCSFIGLHLIPELIKKNVSKIRVINKSERHRDNLKKYLHDIEFQTGDLRDLQIAKESMNTIDVVFHLAADHGGRIYVDSFQGNTASNLLLDGAIFLAALKTDVEKVIYASSGCVYPNFKQQDSNRKIFLKETDVKAPYDADNMYGWAKLMGELTLQSYYKDFGFKSAIGRFFTVYGEYASESHAVMGSLAKAFIKQDPYNVFGDGTQIRNWTYVQDIVDGIILLAEKINNATPINLGTNERISVNEMVQNIFTRTNFHPKKITYTNTLAGPLNRVADITKAKKMLGWKPQYTFNSGLKKTVEWYLANKDTKNIENNIEALLKGTI